MYCVVVGWLYISFDFGFWYWGFFGGGGGLDGVVCMVLYGIVSMDLFCLICVLRSMCVDGFVWMVGVEALSCFCGGFFICLLIVRYCDLVLGDRRV